MSSLPILLLLPLLFGAVIAVLAAMWRAAAAQVIAVVATSTALVLSIVGLVAVTRDGPLTHDLGGWPPPIGIEYVLDPLSAYLACIISLIGLLVCIYPVQAAFDIKPRSGVPLYPLVLLLLTGLMGVVLSGDLFHLFVFLEIYAIATYALVSLGGDRGVFASLRYLLLGTLGSGLYLIGVGFLYFMTGTLNMADMAGMLPDIADSPTVLGAMALIVIGLALKMALFPLHVWLPDAHSYSPPGVAALLAAVQVKAGAYGLVRILFDVFGPAYTGGTGLPVSLALTWFGAAGIVVGSVLAIQQTDLKRMLAYSTVAQLGYIGLGIGLANPLALVGALLHVLNHALMKSGLFLVAGGVIQQTGLKSIPRFAGLGKRMPLVMGGFAIMGLSMVGIPPTAGFFSKWYLVLGSLDEDNWVLAALIVFSSLFTLLYFVRLFEQIFVREPEEDVVDRAEEPGPRIVGTVAVLAGAIVGVGLFNVVIVNQILTPVAERLLPGAETSAEDVDDDTEPEDTDVRGHKLTPGEGSLVVTTDPEVPAQIFVDGVPRNTTAIRDLPLKPGIYEVCFDDVEGFLAPPCETVTVATTRTEVVGLFTPAATVDILIVPEGLQAEVRVDGQRRDAAPVSLVLGEGTHEVCFEELDGFLPPPCEHLEVQGGERLSWRIEYEPSE